MQLGETIATYDVDLALRGETGKFEVTTPTGELFYVNCKPNQFVLKSDWSRDQTYTQAYLIRKIAEPASLEFGQGMIPSVTEATPPPLTPFLIDNRVEVEKAASDPEPVATPPPRLDHATEHWTLDLFYSDSDARTEQPCAFVYLKNGCQSSSSGNPDKLITTRSANFNELDVEIRRVHAQLDEICLRAKKKFYQAYAAAANG
jgi:hypothetical protein